MTHIAEHDTPILPRPQRPVFLCDKFWRTPAATVELIAHTRNPARSRHDQAERLVLLDIADRQRTIAELSLRLTERTYLAVREATPKRRRGAA